MEWNDGRLHVYDNEFDEVIFEIAGQMAVVEGWELEGLWALLGVWLEDRAGGSAE